MSRSVMLVVALVLGVSTWYPAALACGDKFLMVGRGAKFQRVYASVHPGKILIFARPSTDPKAAIRDPQLHKALRQAGHAVSVIEDWALLESRTQDRTDRRRPGGRRRGSEAAASIAASPTHPDALFVAFPSACRRPTSSAG